MGFSGVILVLLLRTPIPADARRAVAIQILLSTSFSEEFAPLAAVLLRTESASSSQIESITAGSRALALAELGLARYGSNAQLVVANVDAMQRAVDLADEVALTAGRGEPTTSQAPARQTPGRRPCRQPR